MSRIGLAATLAAVASSWLASQVSAQATRGAAGPAPALQGLDPVALTEGVERAGTAALVVDRAGFRYLFATADSRARFELDPARYEIQLGGRCALMPGVRADPNLFSVVKGRIYTFGSPDCKTEFVLDPDRYLAPRRNVAIFVHEGVELLDLAGPGEVFAAADHARAFYVYTVAAERDSVVSQGFLTITPQYTLADCPKPDIVVLPGGAIDSSLGDPRVIQWIQRVAPDAEVVMSVCNGAFYLAKAGLLDGQEATTHWGSITALREAAPTTTVHADKRIVDIGKVVTTAGVSAGIDGALHVVNRLLGDGAARGVARYMEYSWEAPPSGR